LVADTVAERVVERLEPVQIDHREGQVAAAALAVEQGCDDFPLE
jgi:hypothetical protein